MDDRQLFETYKETVYLFCRYMVQSRADAEDLCQDVFFKAMIADRTNVQNTKAWLLRIAANECNTFLRSYSCNELKCGLKNKKRLLYAGSRNDTHSLP
ncbi:hypothetical protein PALA111701_31485 [Paenibacillus lactis]|uniref:RNA polymerase sigma factor n=1 Tax=Paenibacillus lactis TaxID=228574 RepID=UPI0039F12638